MVPNKSLVFAAIPTGIPIAGQHIVVRESTFDLNNAAKPGGITGRVKHASFDPYLRHLMVRPEETRPGFEHMPVGSVISNGVILEVLRSNNANLKPGTFAMGMAPIQEFVSLTAEASSELTPIQNPYNLELKYFLGPLGMPGLTGYSAFYEIGRPKKGEVIFISAASGAVGQIVGQLALHEGLTVIGSVGSDEKLQLLTDTLKFDAGFNYKTGNILEQLKRLAPNGIDIYYDNVGGEQLEAAISCLNTRGRIVACGYASQYNIAPENQYGIRNTGMVIGKKLTWRGFSCFDDGMGNAYHAKHQETVGKWISDGSFVPILSETHGIHNAAQGLVELIEGKNVGKALLSL